MFKNDHGFSLIEVLIAGAIFVFMMVMMFSLISNLSNVGRVDSRLTAVQQTKSALRLLSKEIREAANIKAFDVNVSSITFPIDNTVVTYRVNGEGKMVREVVRRNGIPVVPIIPQILATNIQQPTIAQPLFRTSAGNNIVIHLSLIGSNKSANNSIAQFEARAVNRNGGIQ